MLSTYLFHVWLFFVRTKRSGDVEPNPGPKNPTFVKVFLVVTGILTALQCTISSNYPYYIAIHKFDVVCLSETYLNASISNGDDSLEVPRFNLFRAAHPSNTKRRGVCIYYRNSLPLKILGIQF